MSKKQQKQLSYNEVLLSLVPEGISFYIGDGKYTPGIPREQEEVETEKKEVRK